MNRRHIFHRIFSGSILIILLCAAGIPVAAQTFQWAQLPGPPGGYGHVLGVGQGIYFATDKDGNLYRRASGNTWSPSAFVLEGVKARLFASSDRYSYVGTSHGVYRSGNAGADWNPVLGGAQGGEVSALAVRDSVVLAFVNGTTYQSFDAGLHWATGISHPGIGAITNIAITENSFFAIYPIGRGNLYRSTDRGAIWDPIGPDSLTFQDIESIDSTLIALTAEAPCIYRSTDNGATWIPDPPFTVGYRAQGLVRRRYGIVAYGLYGLHEWNSQTKIWTLLSNGPAVDTISSVAGWDGCMVGSTRQGLFLFSGRWDAISSPASTPSVRFVAVADGAILAETERFYRSQDNGRRWHLPSHLDTLRALIQVEKDLFAVASTGISRSSDGGIVWNLSLKGGDTMQVADIAARGSILFAATGHGVYRSTNRGETWERASDGIPDVPLRSIVADGSSLHVATAETVYYSTDDGSTWREGGKGLPNSLLDLAVAGDMLVASTASGLYRSSGGSAQWNRAANAGLTAEHYDVLFAVGPAVFMGTDRGLFISTDYGDTWIREESGPGAMHIRSMAYFNGSLYVGTEGNGIFKGESSLLSAVHMPANSDERSLLECLPNPAANAMTIRYTAKTPGAVDIVMADALGNIVAKISDAPGESGTHMVILDVANFPSGIYFCRLQGAGWHRTERVIIAR